MAITYKHVETGRLFVALEPGDEPVQRERQRAQQIVKLDASKLWERVQDEPESEPEPRKKTAASRRSKPALDES